MANTATAQELPVKRGLFHMLGELWDAITDLIIVGKKGIKSLDDLASTANLHTEDIYTTAQIELSDSRKKLQERLEASAS